uniref:RRM domain-containing protein n=1 Tax=Mesocestoides corti TaxID=53468 RepID=A0A5K3F1C5_MESCO
MTRERSAVSLKRNHEDALEIPAKLAKFDTTSQRFLLPIAFEQEGKCGSVCQIVAALFSVEKLSCISRWSFHIGKFDLHQPQAVQRTNGETAVITTLQDALVELATSVESRCSHETDNQPSEVTLVTNGHEGLRNGLHFEMVHSGVSSSIASRSIWWSYVEIRELVSSAGIDGESFEHNLPLSSGCAPSSTVDDLCRILERYLAQGHRIFPPRSISTAYKHALIQETSVITQGTVVEVRQLPWSATPLTIAKFFRGLNIVPGGVAIKIHEGRRSNTAYVAFETPLEARLACERSINGDSLVLNGSVERQNRASVHRPSKIQITLANEALFLQHSVCRNPDVATFLQQLSDEGQIVVRMRGLPYATKTSDIVAFFAEAQAEILHAENGIYVVCLADCRPTGDAFVLFVDDDAANRALKRHRNYLGQRYVELFKASPSEVVQVCQSAQEIDLAGIISSGGKAASVVNHLHGPQPPTQGNMNSQFGFIANLPGILSTPSHLPSSLQLPFHVSGLLTAPTSLTTHSQLPSMLPAVPSIGVKTADFDNPTDPACPFPQPLPEEGARIVLQVFGLPPSTQHQEMRLYLGPQAFAKVFRMLKITNSLNETVWLLLLANSTDALEIIGQLLRGFFAPPAGSISILPRFKVFQLDGRTPLLPPPTAYTSSQLRSTCMNMTNPDSHLRQPVSHLNAAGSIHLEQPGAVACIADHGLNPHASLPRTSSAGLVNMLDEVYTRLPFDCLNYSNSLQTTGLPHNMTQLEVNSLCTQLPYLPSDLPRFP